MSDQGPSSGAGGSGKPPGEGPPRKHLNGHAVPQIPPAQGSDTPGGKVRGEGGPRDETSVVVPFPKRKKPTPAWLGPLLGWISLLAFAGLVWGVSKDGRVDVMDIGAGLVGVFAALWFYRTR